MIQTINPTTGKVIAQHVFLDRAGRENCLASARESFMGWRRLSLRERQNFIVNLAARLRENQDRLADLIVEEMGKPVTQARSEVAKCADTCDFYGQLEKLLAPVNMVAARPVAEVVFEPLGVILGIMPWNFPLWQVIRFAVPTLLAGNTILLKHAPNTLGCAALLAEIFRQADFPTGVYQDFPVAVEDVGAVIDDRRIAGVSVTGSTRAGRSVGEAAGRALKRVVLELGGSDPYIILDDADLKLATEKAVQARMINGGQSCIAGKRIIVTQKNFAECVSRIETLLKEYAPSDPKTETCRLGPMAREDLRYHLHAQVETAVKEGAKLVMGGVVPKGPGFFYPATLLTEIAESSVVFREELFGPVAAVIEAKDEVDAIRLANRTFFGLGAAVFSRDVDRARVIARHQINSGIVAINGIVRSDPRWPFGGMNDSGLGRELTEFGAREFTNVKTVIVD